MKDGKFVIGFIGMGMGTMESLVGFPFLFSQRNSLNMWYFCSVQGSRETRQR